MSGEALEQQVAEDKEKALAADLAAKMKTKMKVSS
jgi:hypothetical protein